MPPSAEAAPLSDWMEADYFRRPRRLRRLRPLLGWLVLLAAAVAIAVTLWPGTPTVYQAGPLSAAHNMFNDQCHVCHTEAFRTTQRLLPWHSGLSTVTNDACERCHAGAQHNEQEIRTPGCSSCHREHQGRVQLARVADSYCIDCHADIHRKDGAPSSFANVSDFRSRHPEFAIWRGPQPTDPGRVNFNHQLHLNAAGIPGGDGNLTKLTCQSCHQPDSDRRYMKPVTYAQNCASCHPLSVQLAGQWSSPAAVRAADEFRKQPAPHKAPAEVRAELRDRLLSLAEKVPELREGAGGAATERPLPGQRLPAPEKRDVNAWVEQQLKVSERLLFHGAAGCAFCHIRKPATISLANALPVFEPTQVPQRWLMHGNFDHNSHRMLTCTECHAATTSQQTADVLIPRIDSCKQCHNPQVGARSDCSNCHRYHDRSREDTWKGGHFTIDESLRPPTPRNP
jgi:hypothetical protein